MKSQSAQLPIYERATFSADEASALRLAERVAAWATLHAVPTVPFGEVCSAVIEAKEVVRNLEAKRIAALRFPYLSGESKVLISGSGFSWRVVDGGEHECELMIINRVFPTEEDALTAAEELGCIVETHE